MVFTSPAMVSAALGQTFLHFMHPMQSFSRWISCFPVSLDITWIPTGHTSAHAPQLTQEFCLYITWNFRTIPSGLEHHLHRSGQPLKNTRVLIPGPSYMLYFCTLKINALRSISPVVPWSIVIDLNFLLEMCQHGSAYDLILYIFA